MKDAFITLSDSSLRIHYYSAGESGSPVILMHGGGVDSAWLSWKLTLPAMGQKHRVFAPEMPGYGGSDRPDYFEHTIETYGRVVRAFMDALNIERAHLCRVSMGGAMTLHIGLTYPDRVVRLVPVASYGLQRAAPAHRLSYLFVQMPILTRATYAVLRRNRNWTQVSLRGIFADPANLTGNLIDDVFEEIRKPKTGEAFTAFQQHEALPDRMRTNYMGRINAIKAKTMFIHGDKDALVPVAFAREAITKLPGAKLHVMHNCGHWPQRERPVNSTLSPPSFSMTETDTEKQLPPAHLMRAEIFEQPDTLARLIERAEVVLQPVAAAGRRCAFAMLAARGSSDNASTYGKYLIEGLARMPTAQASPSLYTLYDTPPRLNHALVVGVSQSGAAADVISVLEEGRRQGAVTLAVTNTAGSPMTKAAEHVLLLEAGLERALAATKTVTGQCAAYALLAADLADDAQLKQHLRNLPQITRQVLAMEPALEAAALPWLDIEHIVVIGRGYTYGAAEEIALKLKETCFIGAEAYSAADFLHGPLAMIEPGYPVVVLLNHDATLETTVQFMQRVLQRGGNILCLATRQAAAQLQLTDAKLTVLDIGEMPSLLSNIAFIVAGQLFAMHLSVMRGHNPDVSRGVTKVTVTK